MLGEERIIMNMVNINIDEKLKEFEPVELYYLAHCGSKYKVCEQPYTNTVKLINEIISKWDLETKLLVQATFKEKAISNMNWGQLEVNITTLVVSLASLAVAFVTLINEYIDINPIETLLFISFFLVGIAIIFCFVLGVIILKSNYKRNRRAGFYAVVDHLLTIEINCQESEHDNVL